MEDEIEKFKLADGSSTALGQTRQLSASFDGGKEPGNVGPKGGKRRPSGGSKRQHSLSSEDRVSSVPAKKRKGTLPTYIPS